MKKKSKNKISVVIPVYNAKIYISDAIESVLGQTYMNWELIIVDNMSKDDSLKICRAYEKKYENVHVYEEKKKGVGNARNYGLVKATGDFIVFMDADDLLPDENTFKRYIISVERTRADIIVCNYERLWNGKHLPATSHEVFSKREKETKDFRFQGFYSVGTLSYVWGKLYRKEFLEKHHIVFGNYTYAEDKMFNIQCYIYGADYGFLRSIGYTYRMNKESVSFQHREDARENWFRMAKDMEVCLAQNKKQKIWSDLVDNLILFAVFFDGKMEYVGKNKSIKAVKNLLQSYGEHPLGKQSFKRRAFGGSVCSRELLMWKLAMRIFALGMFLHVYYLWALLIKVLVDYRIDERLSDTGVRE